MDTLRVEARIEELPLKDTFRIAREVWDSTRNVFCLLGWGDHVGVGEVSPDSYWGESAEGVVEQLNGLDTSHVTNPFAIEAALAKVPGGSTRCAFDIAMHDLAASIAGISVAEMLGLSGLELPPTSVTIGIDEPDAMVAKAAALADHPAIKLKVGFDKDVESVAAIREVFPGRIRVDANTGWDRDTAIERLVALEPYDIELCEQPIPSGHLDDLRKVTEASPIPVFADEDVTTSDDVARLDGVVDGVNLKLRKTGGIREALRGIAVARAQGMGVMLGCDLTTGVAATAEAVVSTLVDFADIDGPLLLAHDPYPGVSYTRGRLSLPGGVGLGLAERPS